MKKRTISTLPTLILAMTLFAVSAQAQTDPQQPEGDSPAEPAETVDDEVPEEYAEWTDKNRAFFEEGPGYEAA